MIEVGVVYQKPKDWEGTWYDQGVLRELSTSARWSEYLVEGKLVVDVLTPNPNLCLVLVDV